MFFMHITLISSYHAGTSALDLMSLWPQNISPVSAISQLAVEYLCFVSLTASQ